MPEHRVTVTSPQRDVGNVDSAYEIFADDEKLGELWNSPGRCRLVAAWCPEPRQLLSWEQFAARMERD